MAEFINYIIDSPIQPVKTNVLWVKKGVLHYYNKKWIPIAGGGSGNITYPIIDGEGNYSAVLAYSDNKALNISSIALGYNNISRNFAEASFGKYNLSHESDDPSIATLFSVGNGSEEERKNAFEVKEDGEIYIGKRTESLQTILTNLENHPLDDKYAILEEQLQNLDVYTKENISILNSNIESNASKIEENTNKISINAANIEDINSYLKELKNHIDVSDSELESTFKKYKTDVDGALIEMSTSITQTAEEIRLEAEKTKKELDGKITEYEASFSVTAEEIRAEVSRVETDVNGKIVEANSLISQTADAIRTEVSRVELDINGKIIEANSRIEQTANSITSEVYEIEKTLDGRIKENKSSIEQTSEKIESTVESLTILDNKVLNQESKINQTAESIELLVTEVETQGSKIEENTANIEINKNAITSKVEKDDFDALSSAVEETGKEFTEVKQTVSGIETTIQDQTGKVTRLEETVTGLAVKTGTLEADIDSLKKQSDGAIDTHFGTEAPTLNNEPAVNWDTEELKREHTGDLYYNNTTGEAFRWSYDPETETYLWVELTDSALTDALEKISKLEVAIDGKVTIFYNEPSNYKEGDIWFVHNDNYSEFKFIKGQLLTAINANTIFSGEDWEDKTNFASHAEVETAANNLDTYIKGAFLDQTLTVAEVAQIKESKKTFDSLIAEVEESYKYLIVSAVAAEADKTKLEQAYNKLLSEETANEGSYILLVQAVNNLLALDKEEGDDIINLDEAETLLEAYEEAYNTFLTDLKAYYDATSALTENVQAHLNEASKYIENIVSDGVLSPIEKKQLFDIWRQIKEEFIANRGIAVNYKIIKLDEESNYVKNEELYNDKDYFDIYETYLNNYLPLESIFIGSDWGFNDLNVASPTPEGYNTEYIATSFNNYYNALTPFAEMVAEITIAITDAHDKAIALANKLQEHLDPKDEISVIGKGVILSSIIGVKKSSDDTFVSAINAQALDNEDISTVDETHGRVVYAGGIPSTNNWNDSTTVIYEDGHVKFKSGEISDSVSIGETRQAILNKANTLQESLGVGGNTVIDGGLVLSTLLGVVDTEGNLKSVLNASDISKDTVTGHGRIVFAGGIQNPEDWTTAKTLIYEDGYVHFKAGKIDDSVELGTAFIRSVAESEEIDVLSYPQNGTLVPLFQINKDSQGNIISLSVLYDFIANRNVIVHGDTSSTARGTDSGTDGTLIGVVVNGTRYEDETNGMLDLSSLMNQYALTTEIPSLEGYAKLTDIPSLEAYALKTEIPTTMAWTAITGKPSFASVATSGSYNDLSNKPTIPTTLPASDVYAWAKAATKPSYKTSEVAEETNLYFTNARAVSALADTLKDYVTKTALASDLGEYASKEWVNENGYITGITLTGDDYISVNGYKLSLAIDAQGGLTNTGQGLGIYQIPSAKIVTDALGYTPLSTAGGTIGNSLLTINSTIADIYYGIQSNGTWKAGFGWNRADGVYVFNSVNSAMLGVTDNGTPFFGTTSAKKTLYHTGNFNPADYLSKSGGILRDSWSGGTEIRRADNNNGYVKLSFSRSDGTIMGSFGFGGIDNPLFITQAGGYNTLIHSGNYATQIGDYYLKSSGGTISGSSSSVTTPLTINTTYYYEVVDIGFNHKGVNKGGVGLYRNGAWLVYGNERIGIRNDGKPVYALGYNQNGYELYHTGNFNPANYMPLSGGTISNASYAPFGLRNTETDADAVGIAFRIKDAGIAYMLHRGGDQWELISENWATQRTIIHSGNIGSYTAGNAWALRINEIANVNDAITQSFFVAGFQAANRPDTSQNYSTGITLHNNALGYTYQLAYSTSNALYSRRKGANGWESWKTIAFTDSNVASATKLQTARTIWGQSFDGTGNVSGKLTSVTGIDFDTNVYGIRIDDYGNICFRTSASVEARDWSIKASNGTKLLLINNSGNVTIGGSDLAGTSNKLYVDGRIYAKTAFIIDADYGVWKGSHFAGALAVTDLAYYATKHVFHTGNVLIGTTTDNGAKLQVEGYVSISNNNGIYFKDKEGTIRSQLYVDKNNNTTVGYGAMETSGHTALYGTYLRFMTSGSDERMRITNSGNILIGTTTDSGEKLQVAGTAKISGSITSSTGVLSKSYFKVTGTGVATSGLYTNEYISSENEPKRLWLYNEGKIALQGTEIQIFTPTTMSSTLSVGGNVTIDNAKNLAFKDSANTSRVVMTLGSNNLLIIGSGTRSAGYSTVIDGADIHMRATNYAYGLYIDTNGKVVIGSPTTSDHKLYVDGSLGVNGNAVFAGDTSSGSDIRFKDKLSDHRIALSDIAEAPLFTFKWNDREDDSVHLGSSAQYWEKVAPWLVKGEDFKTLDYSTLGVAIGISLANKAVNHEERIKILEKENKALKEQIRRIQYGS